MHLCQELVRAADLIAPVPLHPQRLKQRGFNQALLLAQAFPEARLERELLTRVQDTKPQTTCRNPKERRDNVKGAFTGAIQDADIIFNGRDFRFAAGPDQPLGDTPRDQLRILRGQLGELRLVLRLHGGHFAFQLAGDAGADGGVINIYSARHYQSDDDLYQAFTEATGVRVQRIEGKDDALIERILQEHGWHLRLEGWIERALAPFGGSEEERRASADQVVALFRGRMETLLADLQALIRRLTSSLPLAADAETLTADYRAHREVESDRPITAERLRAANVLVVVAGMEGALPSVVGGWVDCPVVAVPTSVGYGASFGGLSALLTMLNSCASGVSVVNIDNGFGAACAAIRFLNIHKGEARTFLPKRR